MKLPYNWLLAGALMMSVTTSPAMEFRLLSQGEPLTDIKYREGSREINLVAYNSSLSPFYTKADESAPLVIYRTITAPDGKPIKETLVTLAPPAKPMKQALLILAKLPVRTPTGETFVGYWAENTTEYGSVTFYNFCRRQLAVKIQDGQWQQPPGGVHTIKPKGDALSVDFRIGSLIGEEWRLVGNLSIPIRSRLHTLIFIKDSTETGSDTVEVQTLYDEPRPEVKTATTAK
jgi:hypothetical protein